LAAENIDLLLKMFNDNNISILSASPSTDRHILSLYQRHYKLKDNKIYHADIPKSRLDELLAQRSGIKQTPDKQAQTTDSEKTENTGVSVATEQTAQELS